MSAFIAEIIFILCTCVVSVEDVRCSELLFDKGLKRVFFSSVGNVSTVCYRSCIFVFLIRVKYSLVSTFEKLNGDG